MGIIPVIWYSVNALSYKGGAITGVKTVKYYIYKMIGFLFFITAVMYASVGFGGGSTYNALLILMGTEYRVVPLVALICNIIVVSGGVWHFSKSGALSIKDTLPWIVFSVPMAWVGGYIPLSEMVFTGILGITLFLSAIKMLFFEAQNHTQTHNKNPLKNRMIPFFVGGGLGFVAGITGIGGGIFLAPVLYHIRWASAKCIAGMCSIFIWVNSIAGLTGQLMKVQNTPDIWHIFIPYIWVLPIVGVGGQIGAWLGASQISKKGVKTLTGILILYVSIRLLYVFASGI